MKQKIKNMLNVNKNINLSISILYSIIISFTIFICLIYTNKIDYAKKVEFMLNNYIILIIGILFYISIFAFSLCFRKIKEKKRNTILIILSCVLTILLFMLARNYSFKTDWDPNIVLANAEKISEGKSLYLTHGYFSIYPNNILITQVFSIAFDIAKVTKIGTGYDYLLFLQSIIFAWTGFLVYKISTYIKKESNVPVIVWLIYMILIGFSPWIVIPYSDSISLGIVILQVFFYFKMTQSASLKNKKIYILIMTILAFLGYKIKPQTIIFIIAILIVTALNGIKNVKNFKKVDYLKRYSKNVGIMLLSTIIIVLFTNIGINIWTDNCGLIIVKERKLGITHFLMMGWNPREGGVWAQEDVFYSTSFDNEKERKQANIEQFKIRIKDMGFVGVKNQLLRKTLTNYNDATFAYGNDGEFFMNEYKTGNIEFRKFLNEIYRSSGKYYKYFQLIMHIIWLATLFFSIFSFNTKNDKRISVLHLSILGLTLFELIFEARARYLFAYAPLYILLAGIGIDNIYLNIKRKKKNEKDIDCNTNVF